MRISLWICGVVLLYMLISGCSYPNDQVIYDRTLEPTPSSFSALDSVTRQVERLKLAWGTPQRIERRKGSQLWAFYDTPESELGTLGPRVLVIQKSGAIVVRP